MTEVNGPGESRADQGGAEGGPANGSGPALPRTGFQFGVRARWITVLAVVLVAVAVAVWPRGSGPTSQASIPLPAPNLAAVRATADLAACPQATPTASAANSQLARATVSCAANGRTVDFGSVVAGGPTLVNVWAFWCPACRTELPVLAQYVSTPGAVKVLTLMVQSPEADGLQTLAGLGVHLPTVVDANGSASKALKLPVGLPASYLVRPDGTATLIDSLRVFTTVDEVRKAVGQYLGGQ
ncbi:MAG TPA: TlpA disulfide reductase family protein [Pseudonocardiaceae bacterium]|jgi:thiol-disulfide isomerase/thioredoxin|nr:TlpA disulfide reductase family protein [Pseudonocardiaceae bacterium]